MTKHLLRLALAAAVALSASAARAATTSTPLTVKATVQASCVIASIGELDIAYDPLDGNPGTGNAPITINCTKNAGFNVTLQKGAMVGQGAAAEPLTYTVALADGSGTAYTEGSALTGAGPGTKNAIGLTAKVNIPASQNVSADTYVATVNVQVNF